MWQATFLDSDVSKSLVAMFTAVTKATVAARGVAQTTSGIEAVALWLPPGKDLGFWSMVRSGFALPRFAMRLPAPDRSRMMAVLQQLEERRKTLMPNPHWYLAAIGVDPARQGAGLGSRLMRVGMALADRENAAIYLETETEANVGFYQHLGFEVVQQITALGLDLPIWLMVRHPVSRN
jgi:GNAT superfamily N-acetyltransferase